MKNECLWGVDIEFKILMRKVKSPLKQTTPLKFAVPHSLVHRSRVGVGGLGGHAS